MFQQKFLTAERVKGPIYASNPPLYTPPPRNGNDEACVNQNLISSPSVRDIWPLFSLFFKSPWKWINFSNDTV